SRTAAPATKVAIPSLTRPATTSGARLGDCVPAGPGVVYVCMTPIVAPVGVERQSRKSLYKQSCSLHRAGPSSLCSLSPDGQELALPNSLALPAAGHYRTPPTRRTQSATWLSSLTFLGAAGTVTGSNFLLEHDGRRTLVDCGPLPG